MKYDLSKIMKRAWFLVKRYGTKMSSALKEAWHEAKKAVKKASFRNVVKCYIDGIIVDVDVNDGIVIGKTFPIKETLKKFHLRWFPEERCWGGKDDDIRELAYQYEFK